MPSPIAAVIELTVDERERLEYLRRHLERVLPVVSQMESLKEKIQLNGHFKNLPGFEV